MKFSSFPIMAFVYVADQEYNSGCLDSDGADAFLYEKIRSSFFVDVQGIIFKLKISMFTYILFVKHIICHK